MYFNQSKTYTDAKIISLIENLKTAEMRRDVAETIALFKPIWSDINQNFDPPSYLVPNLRAELLRAAGFFLSYSGKAKNLANYQARAKDLLSQAIRIFEQLDLTHKMAEAQVLLSMCYWNNGEILEGETLLEAAASRYIENELHPVYIQICVNRLIIYYYKSDYENAFAIVRNLEIPIEDICSDARLKTMFHNQAGILFQSVGDVSKAFYHIKNAIHFARKCGSSTFEATNYNNLANVYKDTGNYEDAYRYVNKALEFFDKLEAAGWRAHVLDTKANILLHQEKLEPALATVNESISLFRNGEDWHGLADALFLKIKICLRMGDSTTSFIDLIELTQLAGARIGEFAVKKYLEEISEFIYFKRGLSFDEEVRSFKKHLLMSALVKGEKKIVKTAKILGIEKHQTLSNIIRNQYPELQEELGIKVRSRRGSLTKPTPRKKIKPAKGKNSQADDPATAAIKASRAGRPISFLKIAPSLITFYPKQDLIDASVKCFLVSAARLPAVFALKDDAVILCRPSAQYDNNLIIVQNKITEEISCAQIEFDAFSTTYFLKNLPGGEVYSVEDCKVFGEILGYAPLDEASGERIEFKPVTGGKYDIYEH